MLVQSSLNRGLVTMTLAGAVVLAYCGAALGAGPVLWNTLGSDTEVLNSAYGPNLQFWPGGGAWYEQVANRAYSPGVFGGAVSIGPGSYYSQYRQHNIVLDNVGNYVNADRGTIEVWYKQDQSPVAWSNGVYRIFDGAYGLNSGIYFDSEVLQSDNRPWLIFGLDGGASLTSVKYDISALNGQWIHLAGVWDRAGIDGSADKLRLYVNGNTVAATSAMAWGNTFGTADICGGNDNAIANKFLMDNLKIFDYAVTDFSHRFEENWLPEPGCLSLLAVGALLVLRRRSR